MTETGFSYYTLLWESHFRPFCMVEGSVYKRHQSIRCRQEIKNLQMKEGMGCRMLDDFLSGADMSHNQRLALLTNLMQVKGGRKLFFEAMDRYYEPDSVEKWKQYPYYMKGYKPQRCSGQFCPYYGAMRQCRHDCWYTYAWQEGVPEGYRVPYAWRGGTLYARKICMLPTTRVPLASTWSGHRPG